MEATLKQLLIKKRILKGNLTKLRDKIDTTISSADTAQLDLFKKKITKISDDLSIVFDGIYSTCEEHELDQYMDENNTIMEIIDELSLKSTRMSFKIVGDSSNNNKVKTETTEIRLPKLSLPIFDGQLEDWLAFNDLFIASIHNNKNLSDAQRLQYLKSACKGNAYYR